MAPQKKTLFNSAWLQDENFSSWLKKDNNNTNAAYCKFCMKSFSLSNMGRQALLSHASGNKHKSKENYRNTTITLNVSAGKEKITESLNSTENLSQSQEPISQKISNNNNNNLNFKNNNHTICPNNTNTSDNSRSGTQKSNKSILGNFVLKNETIKAEILWCLQQVLTHQSFRAGASSVSLFKIMFPDSNIASSMQLQRTKISYVITCGIAPFFKSELLQTIQKCNYFAVGFDESLNKVSQSGQMDINVRFWDSIKNEICTNYYNSVFIGHSTADDILKAFLAGIDGLDVTKILQISMDGPNVNKKFFNNLKSYLKDNGDANSPVILDLGSCGLHTVHNAFRAGIKATKWNVVPFLRSLYNLFKHVPARRADYTHYSNSKVFPKKFCDIRWVENVVVSARAIEILPFVIKYIQGVKKDKKEPKCDSYVIVASAIEDKFLKAKLTFFQFLASFIEPFLVQFQSDDCLAPLLYESIVTLLQEIMQNFVAANVFESTNLKSVDLKKSENLIFYNDINIGCATKRAIRECKNIKERDVLEFKKDCRQAYTALTEKLLERSPVNYKLVKGVSCLDPNVAQNLDIGAKRLSISLDILIENNWISGVDADKTLNQYKKLCRRSSFQDKIQNYFKSGDKKLNCLWLDNIMATPDDFKELTKYIKIIFTFFHGNSSLERGFSINKDCLIENLQEDSLIAQRLIYDKLKNVGIENIEISNSLIQSVKNSRSRYEEKLKKIKKDKELDDLDNKKKYIKEQQLKNLLDKKKTLVESSRRDISSIDEEIAKLKNK